MGDKARLKRIDHRTATTKQVLRQGAQTQSQMAEVVRRTHELLREVRADGQRHAQAIERHAQAIEDQRVAINQWNLRQETMMRDVLAATQELIAGIREWRNEGVEEGRAQRAALFAILDELKGRGGPATA